MGTSLQILVHCDEVAGIIGKVLPFEFGHNHWNSFGTWLNASILS